MVGICKFVSLAGFLGEGVYALLVGERTEYTRRRLKLLAKACKGVGASVACLYNDVVEAFEFLYS